MKGSQLSSPRVPGDSHVVKINLTVKYIGRVRYSLSHHCKNFPQIWKLRRKDPSNKQQGGTANPGPKEESLVEDAHSNKEQGEIDRFHNFDRRGGELNP